MKIGKGSETFFSVGQDFPVSLSKHALFKDGEASVVEFKTRSNDGINVCGCTFPNYLGKRALFKS